MCLQKLWFTFQGMWGKTKSKNTAENLLLHLRCESEELADRFSEIVFLQTSITDALPRTPTAICPDPDDGRDLPFKKMELLAAIQSPKKNTTPGIDGIAMAAIRNLPEEELDQLFHMFNDIWETGRTPLESKASRGIPIPKPEKPPNEVRNLRPISLTSNLCKLLERMVLNRLAWALETEHRLGNRLTVIRPHLSAQDSLALIHHDLLQKDKRKPPKFLVALDNQKAFDSVPYSTVLQTAVGCGVRGRTLRFIQSFLENRHYEISMGNWACTMYANNIGVPQGFVISPVLLRMVVLNLNSKLQKI